MSHHSHKRLQKVFTHTSIFDNFCMQKCKRFPLFLDFEQRSDSGYGRSQLDIAIDNFDFESFKILLKGLIQLQNCYESSHLVGNWIIEAVRNELDLRELFDSKLCTQLITDENAFTHAYQFPTFHSDEGRKTVRFKAPYTHLLYGKETYNTLFAEKYGTYISASPNNDKQYAKNMQTMRGTIADAKEQG